MSRNFTASEINFLIKHGFDPFELSKSISNQIPVEYIVGLAEFCKQDFVVNKNTLIPRYETEQLIEMALKYVKSKNLKTVNFIDIGAGSGAIGIVFAQKLEVLGLKYNGLLLDISKEALKVAQRNIQKFNVDNLEVKHSDLADFDFSKYNADVLFANLPYIPTSRIVQLESSVKDFEPLNALDGGVDGLSYIRVLLNKLKALKNRKFAVFLEVDDTHSNTKEFENDWNIKVKKDLNGKIRYWLLS